jgi:peroxiredoxin
MSDITPLIPRKPVPALRLSLAGGSSFDIASEKPENFTLLVFYRGLHCPICKTQLRELEGKLGEFEKRGVNVVAISSDDGDRGERTGSDWGLERLRIAYGLDPETARRWWLYISRGKGPTSAGMDEPALFSEPALYLVRADGTLYFGSVQTMPFARPHLGDIIGALDFVMAKGYPARGEVESLTPTAK